MTFLDKTYFHGNIYLPHLSASSGLVGQAATNQYSNMDGFIDDYINKYEPRFMCELLGADLYENFIEGMKAESPLQLWLDLKNALFVESNGFKYSPAANYVYFFLVKKMQSVSTGKGEVRLINSTGEDITPYRVMMDAWNDMSYQVKLFYKNFLCKNWDKYKEYAKCSINSYLYGNKFGTVNEFGI